MFNNLFLRFNVNSGPTAGSPALAYGGAPSKKSTTYDICHR